MNPWQQFYHSIRDPAWPDCDKEVDFYGLPDKIKNEMVQTHGYQPGEYQQQSSLPQRTFPIQSATACQLKWNWSTIYLTLGTTASCHRTNHHRFNLDVFDFHNTAEKISDREHMLRGEWPTKGCEYCQDIERSGGQSDRITNLDLAGIHSPPELEHDTKAVRVTPRILEVYFDNLCNLKCVYCGPHFSSLWDAENKQHGEFKKNELIISDSFQKDPTLHQNKQRMFQWLQKNAHYLTNFNILGGEPLFQQDFDQCLDFFAKHPAPDLEIQIFSNLNASEQRVTSTIHKVKKLIDDGHIRQFTVTASLDCWGDEAEYARFPLKLSVWQRNFELLLAQPWIRLVVGSTVTPLTVKTLPDLVEKINSWRRIRTVHHYFNSVNAPSHLFIDILGDVFTEDFERALDLMPQNSLEQKQTKKYLMGIAQQSASGVPNHKEILKLQTFLDELDRRRNTTWHRVYPWLKTLFREILPG